MIISYEHHGKTVFVKEELMGKHRGYCLCYLCSKLNINSREENCPIANAVYDNCVNYGITSPVFECPNFEKI